MTTYAYIPPRHPAHRYNPVLTGVSADLLSGTVPDSVPDRISLKPLQVKDCTGVPDGAGVRGDSARVL